MKTLQDALTALGTLDADVVKLIAAGGGTTDFQPVVDAAGITDARVRLALGGSTGGAVVASVGIVGGNAVIAATQTAQLQAQPVDATGATVLGAVVVWSSDDVTIATVDQTGLVTGVKSGITNIRATSQGQTGIAGITVS